MAMNADEIIRDFALGTSQQSVHRAGETYIPITDAVSAVNYFRDRDAIVVGFEGFLIEEDATRPLPECVADLSGIPGTRRERVAASAVQAIQIPSKWDRPKFISFAIDGPS
jgi:hypothetical protein